MLIFHWSDASSFSGVISGSGAVTHQGGGKLTLAGANTSSGRTTISGGTLAVSGTGSIGSGKTLAVLGSFLPGSSPGTVTVDPGFTLDLTNSGSGVFEITDPSYAAGTHDLVSGSGSTIFGGVLNLAFSGGVYANGVDVLQLFANNGGRSGTVSAVNATGLAAGQRASFDPAAGSIMIVPEPAGFAISAIAVAGLAGVVRWRKRRASGSPI